MPQKVSSGNHSPHTLGNQNAHLPKKSAQEKKDIESAILQATEHADWSRKLTSIPGKIKKWLFHSHRKEPVWEVLTSLAKSSSNTYTRKSFRKEKEREKEVAIAVYNLHTDSHLPLDQLNKKDIVNDTVAVSTETLEAMHESMKLDGVSLAYEYLRKGKELPSGYFDKVLYPQLLKEVNASFKWLNDHNGTLEGREATFSKNQKLLKTTIKMLAKEVGLVDEKAFSLELMIELDNKIRKSIVKPIEELEATQNNTRPKHAAASAPVLDPPKRTAYFIRDRSTEHIKKTVSQKRFFSKLKLKEVANRFKRVILRNKRNQILFGIFVIAEVLMSVLFPPAAGITIGVAVGVSLAANFNYLVFWTGGTTVFRKLRILYGLKKIRQYADFDFSSVDPKDDKKRKDLIQWLLYVCKHKNFTAIYNEAGDLEKLKDKIEKMAGKPDLPPQELIKLEEAKALYEKKHQKLKENLFFFDLLKENVAIHQQVLNYRYLKDLQDLWQEKFSGKSEGEIKELLKKVSRDKQLLIRGKQIKTDGDNWVRNIIPSRISRKTSVKKARSTPTPAIEDIKLSNTDKSLSMASSFIQGFLFKQVKNFFFANLGNLIKVMGRNVRFVPGTITLPQITIQGTALFAAFFFLDLFSSHQNSKQNQRRMNEIRTGKKGTTLQLFGTRERTEREEIATMRAVAKNEVEPMVDHLLESIKDMEKIGSDLHDVRKRSQALGKKSFGAMSDEDAAIVILKYSAWQHLIRQQVDGAFMQFKELVLSKVDHWNRHLKRQLVAHGSKTLTISAQPQSETLPFLPQPVRVKNPSMSQPLSADGMLQLKNSDIYYRVIQNSEAGKLIAKYRRCEINERTAIKEMQTQLDDLNLDSLFGWLGHAISDAKDDKEATILRRFQYHVELTKNQRYSKPYDAQHLTDSRRLIPPGR